MTLFYYFYLKHLKVDWIAFQFEQDIILRFLYHINIIKYFPDRSKICVPHLMKSPNPHILNISPPLNMRPRWFKDHVGYTMAKYGMYMCVLGMAEEFRDVGIACNALWPRTGKKSQQFKTVVTLVIDSNGPRAGAVFSPTHPYFMLGFWMSWFSFSFQNKNTKNKNIYL